MKVSVIIPTYKDDKALKLILDALQYQTYTNFEIIIAEDAKEESTKRLIQSYKSKYPLKHFSQEDNGNRKPRAVNNSINMSCGEYIIFIDGDTIPFSTFIEYHVLLSDKKYGLCGRRVNLGDKVTQDLREEKITAYEIEKKYFRLFNYLNNDNIRHYEQGICFHPKSKIYKIIQKFDKNIHILASNFSCYKEALLKVNGIDEDLPYAPSRDDFDLEWRLNKIGLEMKSCKFCANLLHLNHPRSDRSFEDEYNKKLIKIKQEKKIYICKNGIEKL
jgi:glycosyltransferase involved in cell wall biosynthesis